MKLAILLITFILVSLIDGFGQQLTRHERFEYKYSVCVHELHTQMFILRCSYSDVHTQIISCLLIVTNDLSTSSKVPTSHRRTTRCRSGSTRASRSPARRW